MLLRMGEDLIYAIPDVSVYVIKCIVNFCRTHGVLIPVQLRGEITLGFFRFLPLNIE